VRSDPKLSAADIAIAVNRAPTMFKACQRVAAHGRERCTSEDFAKALRRYDADTVKRLENRFAALSAGERAAIISALMARL